jgi:hypothetical protein
MKRLKERMEVNDIGRSLDWKVGRLKYQNSNLEGGVLYYETQELKWLKIQNIEGSVD